MSKSSDVTALNRKRAIKITGGKAPSGTEWVSVQQHKNHAWIKVADLMTSDRAVKGRLASAGILILGTKNWNAFIKQVEDLRKFPRMALVEHPGWNGGCFALQSGQVFAPENAEGVCVFEPDPGKCASSGTLEGWLQRVAVLLNGQSLAMFMLMLMFIAPLLRLTNRAGNFGFELVGEGGKGKSMLLKLMASVIGGAADGTPTRYWNTCKTTLNALEKKAEAHSDLPLLLDDATAFAGAEEKASRGRSFKQFVFDLSQGETKDRLDGKKQRYFRLVYAITSNLSLGNVIAEIADVEKGATQDRHITFNTDIPAFHTFDYLPEEYADVKGYADDLIEGMAAEYGTAMPHFLQALVNHRARDEARLKRRIKERVNDFMTKVGVDRNDGSPGRVAEAIALGVTGGQLAQHYGALPKEFDCEAAGIAAYRLYLASAERSTPKQRLLAYAAAPTVIDMATSKKKYLSEDELRDAAGVYRDHKEGQREFLVEARTFRRAFPDYKSFLENTEIDEMRVSECGRRGPKREVVKGRANDRFYSFLLD